MRPRRTTTESIPDAHAQENENAAREVKAKQQGDKAAPERDQTGQDECVQMAHTRQGGSRAHEEE